MTAARPDTWMPIYWGDYARDTGHLNALAHGAYLMLIKHYWCTGSPLNDDDSELWRVACCDSLGEWKRIRNKLSPLFQILEGKWRHKRIDRELQRAVDITNKRAAAGRASAEHRANKNSTHVEHTGQQNAIPSQPQPPSEAKTASGAEAPLMPDIPPIIDRRNGADDPVKAMFDTGVSILTKTGNSEQKARSMIGKWRKQLKDDGKLLGLLVAAGRDPKVEPIGYITKAIGGSANGDDLMSWS